MERRPGLPPVLAVTFGCAPAMPPHLQVGRQCGGHPWDLRCAPSTRAAVGGRSWVSGERLIRAPALTCSGPCRLPASFPSQNFECSVASGWALRRWWIRAGAFQPQVRRRGEMSSRFVLGVWRRRSEDSGSLPAGCEAHPHPRCPSTVTPDSPSTVTPDCPSTVTPDRMEWLWQVLQRYEPLSR